jgi:hypothetical protein
LIVCALLAPFLLHSLLRLHCCINGCFGRQTCRRSLLLMLIWRWPCHQGSLLNALLLLSFDGQCHCDRGGHHPPSICNPQKSPGQWRHAAHDCCAFVKYACLQCAHQAEEPACRTPSLSFARMPLTNRSGNCLSQGCNLATQTHPNHSCSRRCLPWAWSANLTPTCGAAKRPSAVRSDTSPSSELGVQAACQAGAVKECAWPIGLAAALCLHPCAHLAR